jgi:hypothetical protein
MNFVPFANATNYAPTGLPGATAVSRYAGATASGAPVSGTFQLGDFVVDQSGAFWICTVAGTPGTWTEVGLGRAGQFLAAPHVYQTGTQTAVNITAQTLTAFDSANMNTGNFVAPPSGSVLVRISCVMGNSAAAGFAVGLTEHGTVTPVLGFENVVLDSSATATHRPYTFTFVVTGLVAGSTHNFDFVAATTSTDTLTTFIIGVTATTPTLTAGSRGAPFIATVQAI